VIAQNQYGKGTVFYVGSIVDKATTSSIVKLALNASTILPIATSNNELMEVTEVVGTGGNFLYAINFSNEDQTIQLTTSMCDVLTKERFRTSSKINAMDYRVLMVD